MATAALVLVATPIGNLGDISERAADELRRADAICCEDTRRTGKLLAHLAITDRRLIVINDHTEVHRTGQVLERIGRGERVVVVTDAGMPGISDPGERLVAAAAAAGCLIEVIPGPSAAITALVASGLPTGRFIFEGFLPRKGSGRTARLATLATERRTMILYEAPHRLARTLVDLAEALGGDRRVAVARELTKLHEEIFRGTLDSAIEWAEAPRGEVVLVVAPGDKPVDPTDAELLAAVEAARAEGASTRDAAASVAADFGVGKRRVYALATDQST